MPVMQFGLRFTLGLLTLVLSSCVSNYQVVDKEILYRSGQPSGLGLNYLRRDRIKTVINLRAVGSSHMEAEKAYCQKHGINFINQTIGHDQKSLFESANAFLAIMNDPKNHPVLVHCSRGKERSGFLAAIYLISNKKWSNQAALNETFRLGLEPGRMPQVEKMILTWGTSEVLMDESDSSTIWIDKK